MTYRYPDSDLHDPGKILGLTGSFWSGRYQGRDQLLAYCAALGEAGHQAQLDLLELIASLSRRTVPIHHIEQWTALYLRESEQGMVPAVYGAAGAYGGTLRYGDPAPGGQLAWPCPVAGVDVICNRIGDPSATLVRGVDYTLKNDQIVFRDDPFLDHRFAAQPVLDEAGDAVDTELTLWLFRARTDREHIWTHFGYILGLKLPSSPGYRDVVNAVLDAIVGGTAVEQVAALLSAITEVVEAIVRERDTLLVITDQVAYRFPAASHPVVSPGQRLSRGDPLVDTLTLFIPNRGEPPDWLSALALGPGLVMPGLRADLTFEDRDVPLIVTHDEAGLTRVSWSLGGFAADTATFWTEVHRRGVASGLTLARLLDRRESPVGEPTAASLPATINPLRFLMANFLRYNTLLVRIRADALGPNALGLEHLRLLRRIVPPHVLVLTTVELSVAEDSATVDLVTEELDSYSGTDPLDDGTELADVVEGPPAGGPWAGTCQVD
jgi:hypothetical protein